MILSANFVRCKHSMLAKIAKMLSTAQISIERLIRPLINRCVEFMSNRIKPSCINCLTVTNLETCLGDALTAVYLATITNARNVAS